MELGDSMIQVLVNLDLVGLIDMQESIFLFSIFEWMVIITGEWLDDKYR